MMEDKKEEPRFVFTKIEGILSVVLNPSLSGSQERDLIKRGEVVSSLSEASGLLKRSTTSTAKDVADDHNFEEQATCLYPMKNGHMMIMGTAQGYVYFIDRFTGIARGRLEVHRGKVTDLDVDSTENYMLSASVDGKIIIYDIGDLVSGQVTTAQKIFSHDSYSSPIFCAKFHPTWSPKNRKYFYGTALGQLYMNQKGWFSTGDILIHEGEGIIHSILLKNDLLAWTNQFGVKVYDLVLNELIASVEKPSFDEESFPAIKGHIYWEDQETLLIAWYDIVRIVKVVVVSDAIVQGAATAGMVNNNNNNNMPISRFSILACFDTDFLIYGILPFTSRTKSLALLAQTIEHEQEFKLCIVSRDFGIMESSDLITGIRMIDSTTLHSFGVSMSGLQIGNKLTIFITFPLDIIYAEERTLGDRIEWALENKGFEEAIEMISSLKIGSSNNEDSLLDSDRIDELVSQVLRYLVQTDSYDKAKKLCPILLGSDRSRWSQWAAVFADRNKLSFLADVLPVSKPTLSKELYSLMFTELLNDRKYWLLLRTLRRWRRELEKHSSSSLTSSPGRLFPVKKTDVLFELPPAIEAVSFALKQDTYSQFLRDISGELLIWQGHYHLALLQYLTAAEIPEETVTDEDDPTNSSRELGRLERAKIAFGLIDEHVLLPAILDRINALFLLDEQRAIELFTAEDTYGGFVEHSGTANASSASSSSSGTSSSLNPLHEVVGDSASPDWVISKMIFPTTEQTKLRYLHALFTKRRQEYNIERYTNLHNLQVQLYVKYDPANLLDFLQVSTFYSIDEALELCKAKNLYEAMVYLYGRMGGFENKRLALKLVIKNLQDVSQAIQLVEKDEDEDLWDVLIDLCMKKPELLSELLKHAGAHNVDPVRLIQGIPSGMQVPQLKQHISRIFNDVRIQISIREGCALVLRKDVMELLRLLHRKYKSAVIVRPKQTFCGICQGRFGPMYMYGDIIVFHSGEVYHRFCLDDAVKNREDIQILPDSSLLKKHCQLFAQASRLAATTTTMSSIPSTISTPTQQHQLVVSNQTVSPMKNGQGFLRRTSTPR